MSIPIPNVEQRSCEQDIFFYFQLVSIGNQTEINLFNVMHLIESIQLCKDSKKQSCIVPSHLPRGDSSLLTLIVA